MKVKGKKDVQKRTKWLLYDWRRTWRMRIREKNTEIEWIEEKMILKTRKGK